MRALNSYRMHWKTMNRRSCRQRKVIGLFNLIELLIVIVIIVILIGILLPALNQAREKTKVINCASAYKQIALACFMYAHDYEEYLPPLRTDNYPMAIRTNYTSSGERPGAYLLYRYKYLPSLKHLSCPANPVAQMSQGTETTTFWYMGYPYTTWSLNNLKKIDRNCKVMLGDRYVIDSAGRILINHRDKANWVHPDGSVKTYSGKECKYLYAWGTVMGNNYYAPYQLTR